MAKATQKTVESTGSTNKGAAATSAPVVATNAAEARKAAISVGATKKAEKAPAKPAFQPNVARRTELLAMSGPELITAAGEMKEIEAKDGRVFGINDGNVDLKDQLVGSDLSRSGIRSAVIDFLRSREGNQATGAEISAYMHLASGVAYKGRFNIGYLAARGSDVRRGMVARKQLVIVSTPEAPAKTETAATT